MSKNKQLKGQKCWVQANHQRRLQQRKIGAVQWDDQQLGKAHEGVVVSRFSMHADVEDAAGFIYHCNLRRTLKSLARVIGWYDAPVALSRPGAAVL